MGFLDIFSNKDYSNLSEENILLTENFENKVEEFISSNANKYIQDKYLDEKVSLCEQIAEQVKHEGYVLLKGVIDESYLKGFRQEFDSIISEASNSNFDVDEHEGAICVRVKPISTLDENKFPLTTSFFKFEMFIKISEYFYGENRKKILINNELFVHETPATNDPLSAKLHWDRAQTLKFWIYIDDLPEEAGPMRIVKGSVERNKKKRIESSKNTKKVIGGKDNIVNDEGLEVHSLSGPIGSILIHDTDAAHGATKVEKGFNRRIMRGHTRFIK